MYNHRRKGSLEVKLLTIGTGGKAKVRAVRKEKESEEKESEEKKFRRERVRRKKVKVREKAEKSRNTLFLQC